MSLRLLAILLFSGLGIVQFVSAFVSPGLASPSSSDTGILDGPATRHKNAEQICQQQYQRPSAKALIACRTALDAAPDKAANHQRMGQLHFRAHRLGDAEKGFAKALELSSAGKDELGIALAINGQARVKRARGAIISAVRLFNESLSHCEKNAKCLAGNHDAIGYLLLKQRAYAEAESHFTDCARNAETINSAKLLASCQYGLATAHFQRGQFKLAKALCEQSLSLYQSRGNKRGMAAALGCLSSTAKQLKAGKEEWCGYVKRRASLYRQIGNFQKSFKLYRSLQESRCTS